MNKPEAKRLVCRAVAQFMLHHDGIDALGLPEDSDRIEAALVELERRAGDAPEINSDNSWTKMWKPCPKCGGPVESRELNDHPDVHYRCKDRENCGWSKKVDGPDA